MRSTGAEALALSVIVPTYGRAALLHALLEKLAAQTLAPERFEVVAVDDGSPEPITAGPVRHPFALTLLRQANAGPGAARNLALEHVRAPLALILNDDAVPAPDLLERHLAAHAEAPPRTAVLGTFRFAPELLASPFVQLLDSSDLLFDFERLRHGALHDWRFFWTCNLSVPADALRAAGGFDAERFREAIVEDVELGYRLAREGWGVLYREDAVCHHAHRVTPRGYFERMVRLGVNLVRMWQKHRDPQILWSRVEQLEPVLQDWQLFYEQHRENQAQLCETLERIEATQQGRVLPAEVKLRLTAAVRKLSLVGYARGAILEGAGYDPEPHVASAPRAGALTSVVIVSYQALERTRRCLEALRAAREPAHPIEILAVDNGSTDGSAEFLATQPDVVLIRHEQNLGAPRARNLALPHARGEWIAFLDNDAVVTPGWLSRLRWHADADPRVGCVCPVSDRAAHGQQIPYEGGGDLAALAAFADQRAGVYRRRARYGLLFTSFCVLVRREVLERIGGFDPRFSPWGFEDDDFSLRARLAGFRTRIALDVFVRHESYGGAKQKRHEELLVRNWRRFAEKWMEGSPPAYGDYRRLEPVLARTWSDAELHVPLGAASEEGPPWPTSPSA
jgi:GT2 family glycosyltransferase